MLKLEHLCKTFNVGTVNERRALCDLSLHLRPGDYVTVIGSKGAGKSTMLNAVAGVWPVDAGRILLDGEDITGRPEHKRARHIGRVFQDPMMGTPPTCGWRKTWTWPGCAARSAACAGPSRRPTAPSSGSSSPPSASVWRTA